MHIIHTCPHTYICTHSCTCMHLCSDKYTFMNTNYIHTGPCTHTHTHVHMHTSAHICFLNICLSYHPCSVQPSFLVLGMPWMVPGNFLCIMVVFSCAPQLSLWLIKPPFSGWTWWGPPSLWPTLFMGTCPCPQAQAVKLYHHLFFHLSVNVTCSVLMRSIENYKTSNTPYQPCYCKPWGMLGQ